MPRRRAAERHTDSEPRGGFDPQAPSAAVLSALHHPLRRSLHTLLSVQGPSSVGRLAAALDVAAGSASHHLKVLHRAGMVVPAPEHARDTRESWWRAEPVWMTWSTDDFPAGSADREVAVAAERAAYEFNLAGLAAWLRHRHTQGDPWAEQAGATDSGGLATEEQLGDLSARLSHLVRDWYAEVDADRDARPDVPRRPIRVFAHSFVDVRFEQ